VLAADHRARGIVTLEDYSRYVAAIRAALPACDGILASTQPMRDLEASGSLGPEKKTYLSLNRTGLAGSVFELDDRLVTSVRAAKEAGMRGVKHMVRIDLSDPVTASSLELLGKVLEEARTVGLEAMVEAVSWRDGHFALDTDSIVFAAVVAHDLGAPLLKLPMPDAAPGAARVKEVERIVRSVGVPVLFLGGARRRDENAGGPEPSRELVLALVRDAMDGGAAGVAVGRAVIEDPDPALMARMIADVVRSER